MVRTVVYTDLDGTLLDHDTYSWLAAAPMLEQCRDSGIPVVPCTSKTRAELLPLRTSLDNSEPFIIENGAAVLIPATLTLSGTETLPLVDGFRVMSFVAPRSHWLDVIARAHAACDRTGQARVARGFSEMTAAEIAGLTGLSEAAAEQAAAREYGEPLHWRVPEAERSDFKAALLEHGAVLLQGGRFAHVSGASDKGRALRWLQARYAETWGESPVSIAAGDSHNDVAMLEAADWALVVRSPVHEPPRLVRSTNCLVSDAVGPSGWSEGLARIFAAIQE